MPIPVQKFRELVFQLLYSQEIGQADEEALIELLMQQLGIPRDTVKSALTKVHAIHEKLKDIDSIIAKSTTAYEFPRIPTVEKNILRLSTFELLYEKETIPPKVSISEAIRLTRKFSTPEAATFVNAILDQIYHSS